MNSPTAVIAIEWVFMGLAYIFVAARLYVRLRMKRMKLQLSDVFLLIGLMFAQGLVICDTLTYHLDAMNNFTDPDPTVRKIRFATNYCFDFGIYWPKFSIIAFYYVLVPTTNPHMRIALYILAGITVSSSLFTLFADTFWCGPDPSVNWTGGPDSCSVFSSMNLMRANWALNFGTEILNVVYPFPLLADLMLKTTREKISLFAIFGLGFLTIGVSIGRFVTMVYVANAISVYIWATAEICISIIVVSMTALRPLLKKISAMISTNMTDSRRRTGYEISSGENGARRHSDFYTNPGRYWRQHVSKVESNATASRGDDMSGSEVELTERGIVRTKEVTISHEVISPHGSTSSASQEHV